MEIYHGSNVGDIKEFKLFESTQEGQYIYATYNYVWACIFGIAQQVGKSPVNRYEIRDGKTYFIERKQNQIKNNDGPIYVYIFDDNDFKNFNTDNYEGIERRTNIPQKPKKVIKYNSALELLKSFENEGKLELFFYPNKPQNFSIYNGDIDLLYWALGCYLISPKNIIAFDKLILNFPQLAEKAKKLKNLTKTLNKNQLIELTKEENLRKL